MIHKLLVLLAVILFSFEAQSQDIYPAKVSKPILWLLAKNNQTNYSLENRTSQASLETKIGTQGELFNFNPALDFDGSLHSIKMSLDSIKIKQQTLFLVYKIKDSLTEQFLWHLATPTQTASLATNKRLVNLTGYDYKTYTATAQDHKANIHFYQHNRSDLKENAYQISFGNLTSFEKLPPIAVKTLLSEIILYDRVLSPIETQKVASYLAVKYGISLSQLETKDYLNSQGTIIWKQESHKGFEESITAIGRDDKSGLLQLKSTNAFENKLLTIGFNGENKVINDHYFVFWSDNGKPLTIKKQEQGQPSGISRKWILDFSKQEKLGLDWEFDLSQIKTTTTDLATDLYYWLQVDTSGTGQFEAKNLDYQMLAPVTTRQKVALNTYAWDKAATGKTAFSIKLAPIMFASVVIAQPSCGQSQSGSLNFKIVGGKAPYELTITDSQTGSLLKTWVQEAASNQLFLINSGYYNYQVTDAQNHTYSDRVYVPDSNGVSVPFQSEYKLLDGQELSMDAQLVLPAGNYQYQWFRDDNLISTASGITISQEGAYELRLETTEGCKSSSSFYVRSTGTKKLLETKVMVYPNPTSDGDFTVQADFPSETSGTLTIFSITGQKISEAPFYPQQTLSYQGTLHTAGVYSIKISSFFGEENLKLIVK